MPKITNWQGPSHTDDEGNPVAGPVGTQVVPDAPDELIELDRHPDEPQDEGLGEFVGAGPHVEFDPSAYSVSQVNDYLADVDDDERARVLNAEAAGKNRSGIMNGRAAGLFTAPDEL